MTRYLGKYEGAAYALMRIAFAFLYWCHGPRWLFGLFTERGGVPWTSLRGVAGMIETTLGPFIFVGLFAPYAAFIASGEMAFAYFLSHIPRGSVIPIVNGGEITVALCFGMLYIATRGSGPFSVDAWLASRRAAKQS